MDRIGLSGRRTDATRQGPCRKHALPEAQHSILGNGGAAFPPVVRWKQWETRRGPRPGGVRLENSWPVALRFAPFETLGLPRPFAVPPAPAPFPQGRHKILVPVS